MTQDIDSPGPRRADVADSYDLGVDAYEVLWSPVILPPATDLVTQLELNAADLIVDVGAGTGALLTAIRSAAPGGARTLALDASEQMLRLARADRVASAVLGDALALPLADGCADAVALAYVLFHLAHPIWALAEAARVLRPGGRVGTVTWAWERDHADALTATLRWAGLRPMRIWPRQLRRQWDPSSYLRLAAGGGANRARLPRVDAATRADVLRRLERALDGLGPADLLFEGEVLCAIATA